MRHKKVDVDVDVDVDADVDVDDPGDFIWIQILNLDFHAYGICAEKYKKK